MANDGCPRLGTVVRPQFAVAAALAIVLATAGCGRQAVAKPPQVTSFSGKFAISSLSFPNAKDGFVLISGFPGGNGRLRTWIDTTSDAGKTWSLGPTFPISGKFNGTQGDVGSLSFASQRYGFAYGVRLYGTSDGGRHWQVEPTSATVVMMAAGKGSTWAIEDSCANGMTEGKCSRSLWRSPSPGQPLAKVSGFPPVGSSSITGLDPLSASTAYLLTPGVGGSPQAMYATYDGGRTWHKRTLPCQATGTDLAGSVHSLWLTCAPAANQYAHGGAPQVLYRSQDGGHSWLKQVTPVSTQARRLARTQVVPTSSSTAWAWGATVADAGKLLMTTDGGASWSVAPPRAMPTLAANSQHSIMPQGFAAVGTRFAALGVEQVPVAQHGGRFRFAIVATSDGGKSWSSAYLPIYRFRHAG